MNTHAIVPVKELDRGKSRLSKCLTDGQRKGLLLSMLEDVLPATRRIRAIVISPVDISSELVGANVEFLLQKVGRDLDSAVRQANSYALEHGAEATLFIPGDMPLIRAEHVNEILDIGREHDAVITRSSDGGTGVLYRRPPNVMESRFTMNSFRDHLQEAEKKGVDIHVHKSFPLSLDIDTLEDIYTFMEHGKGTRTHAFLKGCGY